ncbi:MAG: C40 family peptidase [Sphingomonadaceae bacterium]|nr:C40 family peptidase [Sphingomonadaceae bacterium]
MTGASGAALMAAARALIGTPFRLHGRDAAHGLDCVGLVRAALCAAGHMLPPDDARYPLRGWRAEQAESALNAAGLGRVIGAAAAGDILLGAAQNGQLHLMIQSDSGYIHAHLGLGRVVEQPGDAPMPILSCWRIQNCGEGLWQR